ncbi:MAG: tRNA lysidine(34) synthetase TilS [Erythrobacter sp.]|uniref:tRNA lysidine(34) synthetase TilS n=1 Tax=Marinobacter alexandrii TaxID=2570351 RepID=UPI003299E7D2
MDRPVSPDLTARFRAVLETHGLASRRLGIAVSGGADSLALLLLAHSCIPDQIEAATVDHSLRPESASEVEHVAQICEQLGVRHTALKVEVEPRNVQANARAARYAALGKWHDEAALDAIMTAHHADDQAETLLMRLNRGSGLSGLSGVRAINDIPGRDGLLVRPLLSWRKAELEEIVKEAGLAHVDDPSNFDPRFDRARVRTALQTSEWLDSEALATSATRLSEAWAAIEWFAREDWESNVQPLVEIEDQPQLRGFRYSVKGPRLVAIETILRIIGELGGKATRSDAGRLYDRLFAGDNASLGGVLAVSEGKNGCDAAANARVWRFAPEPPRSQP